MIKLIIQPFPFYNNYMVAQHLNILSSCSPASSQCRALASHLQLSIVTGFTATGASVRSLCFLFRLFFGFSSLWLPSISFRLATQADISASCRYRDHLAKRQRRSSAQRKKKKKLVNISSSSFPWSFSPQAVDTVWLRGQSCGHSAQPACDWWSLTANLAVHHWGNMEFII